MVELVDHHRMQITEICRRYRVKRLELFGSAAGEQFNLLGSDIDFFYEFDPADIVDLADRYFALQQDLEKLLGVPVDLASASDVTNPYFLQVANRQRLTLYAA